MNSQKKWRGSGCPQFHPPPQFQFQLQFQQFRRPIPPLCTRLVFASLFIYALASAQTLSFGVIGGASLTPDFNRSFYSVPPPGPPIVLTNYSSSQHYIVGAMLELRLPKNWSIEVDGLYHPLRFNSAGMLPNGTLTSVSPSPVITWEFPALAKYRFRWRSWRPFLEAGPSFRTAGNLNGSNPSHYGVLAGAGIETHLGTSRIAPEIRYIRWAQDTLSSSYFPAQKSLVNSFRLRSRSRRGLRDRTDSRLKHF